MGFLYILKTGTTFSSIRKKHGDFDTWTISALLPDGLPLKVLDVEHGEELPPFEQCLGAVITGSHAMVTDNLSWSLEVEQWLPSLVEREIPLLAICYGHQLLARAMGGEVGYHPRGIETGTVEITLDQECSEDPLLASLPRQFKAHTDHSQSITRLPKGAVCLAHSRHEPNHIIRIGPCAWGLQFHPEFSAAIMELYIRQQENKLSKSGLNIAGLLEGVCHTPAALGIARRFSGIVRQISSS